jgi:hypothetical protein
MGMRDESWCFSCGTSLPYSETDVECGECVREELDKTISDLLDFVKGRIVELTEVRAQYESEGDYEMDDYTAGAIDAYDIVRMKLNG